MSNDNVYERLWKQQVMIGKMVMDGKRDPEAVSQILQGIIAEREETLKKFALLADLGEIVVPAGYASGTQLVSFKSEFQNETRKSFVYYNDDANDVNFPNPSRILKPGDRIGVCAYKQIVPGTTTSEERMKHLRSQPGNIFTGPHGNSLVFAQKRNQLPKGFWYASFDEKERCWKDSDGDHRVSNLGAVSDGDFGWGLGILGGVWYDNGAFFGFRDLSQPSGA